MRKRLVSNVGAGAGVSVRELLSIVEKELGLRVDVEEKPIRPGDPPRLVADNAYLRTWFDHTFKSVDQAVRDIAATSRTMS
jgi:UDP-glucose 4-epimerase